MSVVPVLCLFEGERLISLAPSDLLIVVLYFAMVLGIGFYLRKFSSTSDDFFMAGRDMSAWVAGLSFLSANLGALELMGWAAAAYQYGILATHFYWIAAFPSMVFLGLVMMPFTTSPKPTRCLAICNCGTAKQPALSAESHLPS